MTTTTPNPDGRRLWRNGIFTVGALVVIAVFVLTIGSKNQLLARKSAFTTRVPSASGLKEGDSVMFLGVRVGVIDKLEITGAVFAAGDAPSVPVIEIREDAA